MVRVGLGDDPVVRSDVFVILQGVAGSEADRCCCNCNDCEYSFHDRIAFEMLEAPECRNLSAEVPDGLVPSDLLCNLRGCLARRGRLAVK